MSNFIPYGRQSISEADIEVVLKVLRSDFITQGPNVSKFEEMVANKCGARHAVAVNSATSALHIACLALEVARGDVVWTTPITFVASANCARYCGADVDFIDIDPETWCISVDKLEEKLLKHEKKGLQLPKVVIPVHLSGQSCDMLAISELGLKYGFRIIEDASHAIGGFYKHKPVGNCSFSDISVFSFHPAKIITTGEGGLALTNSSDLYQRMARLRTHGIVRDPQQMTRKPTGPWYYEQLELGFNYRMTDIQAALGLSQMSRLDNFVTRRNKLAQRYNEAFSCLPIRTQQVPEDVCSSRHLYIIRVDTDRHSSMYQALREKNIGVNLHYIPVHLQPYYRSLGFYEGQFPQAESYGVEAISLPLYPLMTDAQQEYIIDHCRVFIENIRR